MHRNSTHAGHASRAGRAVRLALAVALASGVALGGTAPAFAKDAKQQKSESNSKAFVDAYGPMQKILNNSSGDFAAAKAMIPTVQAAIQNDTDKETFGKALIMLGGKLNDVSLQKQGIELALASGKTPPQQAAMFHDFLGKWAYNDKNYAEARSQLQQAVQGGYTQDDPEALIVETYFGEGQNAQGLQALSSLIQRRNAAGQQVPANWYLRGLKVAYENRMAPQAESFAQMLVSHDPTPTNWQGALQVVNAVSGLDSDGRLDLYRLMRQTGALKAKQDYLGYIDAADPQKLSNEVLPVLDEAVKAGVLTTSDPFYTQSKSVAEGRAADHKKVLPEVAADARKAADGKIAMSAGDQYFSIGDYANAAQMYQLAVDKGGTDHELALERLGMAQAEQGQWAPAKAALQQVTGARAPVAKMWLAYIDSKTASPAPSAPPANGA